MPQIQCATTKTEAIVIDQTVERAARMAEAYKIKFDYLSCSMDISACHCNGCRLDLARLLTARDMDFGHDVFGISRYIDRTTGQFTDHFVPRYAAK